MCGRFNVIDSPEVQTLLRVLNIQGGQLRFTPDAAPGSVISIVRDSPSGHILTDAIWWLSLDENTWKPNYFRTSFNSRWDKLNTKGYVGYEAYRTTRCIIPASAFAEGLGDKKIYHKIELVDSAIAFGGLYKHYINTITGESVFGASIITLGPVAQWDQIHPNSQPLMLPIDNQALIDAWLDKDNPAVDQFEPWLDSVIRSDQRVTPIGRPSKWDDKGPSWTISAGK